MSDLRKKPNPEIDRDLENKLIAVRGALTEVDKLIALKSEPGWVSMRQIMEAQLYVVESKLDEFEKYTDKARDFWLKERIDIKQFLGRVEKSEEKKEELLKLLSEVEHNVEQRKATRPERPVAI